MSDPTEYLTAAEAADALKVSPRTLSRYVAAGLIAPRQRMPRGRRLFLAFDVDRLARGECVHCGSTSHTRHPSTIFDHPQGQPYPDDEYR